MIIIRFSTRLIRQTQHGPHIEFYCNNNRLGGAFTSDLTDFGYYVYTTAENSRGTGYGHAATLAEAEAWIRETHGL